MPKFAANLSWLFTEHDFLDRFEAAAKAGFRGIECLFPYDFNALEVRKRLADHDLQAVLINAPPGDWARGDRGLGCLNGREYEFRKSIEQAIDFALAIDCPKIHIMAGIGDEQALGKFVENLGIAAELCGKAGLKGLIEPINNIDMPGYFLTRYGQAVDILRSIGSPHLGMQLDLYHVVRMGGDPSEAIKVSGEAIAHFQIAGASGRHEPDDGKIDYQGIFESIDLMEYDGWIGCEYQPRTNTNDGLGWLSGYLSE